MKTSVYACIAGFFSSVATCMHIQSTDRYTIIDQLKGYYSFTAITQEFVPPHNIMKYIIV